MYAKQLWPFLADALQQAHGRRRVGFRQLADFFYWTEFGRVRYDPASDRYFLITAADQKYKHAVTSLSRGRQSLVGSLRSRVVERRLHGAELRPLRREANDVYRGALPGFGAGADRAGGRDELRPGNAVPRRTADGSRAWERTGC